MTFQKVHDLIILGAGPGGLEAARYAAARGLHPVLISKTKLGGRATWGSLVPSKVWLATAEQADRFRRLGVHGIRSNGPAVTDVAAVRQRIGEQSAAAAARYARELQQLGVELIEGAGRLVDTHIVEVQTPNGGVRRLAARFILIATGSEPRFLPELKPNGDRIIAPRLSSTLAKIPDSLLMAGGGVTGSEYAFAFAALGARVTILHNREQLVPRVDPVVAAAFEHHLTTHYDITIERNDPVVAMHQEDGRVIAATREGRTLQAEYGFIAIGRTPDLDFYAWPQVDLRLDRHGMVAVDAFSCTNIPGVYAVGDVTGAPMVANRAILQARLAVRHMLDGDDTPLRGGAFIEAAYTHPAVAQVGDMTPDEHSQIISRSFGQLLKSHVAAETEGLLRIRVDRASGLIRGAAGFGPHVTEVLAVMQLAINNDIPYERVWTVPFAHPSLSEVITG